MIPLVLAARRVKLNQSRKERKKLKNKLKIEEEDKTRREEKRRAETQIRYAPRGKIGQY